MKPETIFITRYVASHADTLAWYEAFFGRPADNSPVPNCREWELQPGIVFQVIEHPQWHGRTQFAFRVDSLDDETTRLRSGGVDAADPFKVEGFETLRFAGLTDPEGVETGMLDGR